MYRLIEHQPGVFHVQQKRPFLGWVWVATEWDRAMAEKVYQQYLDGNPEYPKILKTQEVNK